MTDTITPKQFHDAAGIYDWRVLTNIACAHFRTKSFVALSAGGRLVTDEHAPAWWTLADAEGNEVDVATWMGRD